jgi:hypothetical protein
MAASPHEKKTRVGARSLGQGMLQTHTDLHASLHKREGAPCDAARRYGPTAPGEATMPTTKLLARAALALALTFGLTLAACDSGDGLEGETFANNDYVADNNRNNGDNNAQTNNGDAPEPIHVEVPEGCNPMATSDECILPFPSGYYQKEDANSPTGVRMNYDADKLPFPEGGHEAGHGAAQPDGRGLAAGADLGPLWGGRGPVWGSRDHQHGGVAGRGLAHRAVQHGHEAEDLVLRRDGPEQPQQDGPPRADLAADGAAGDGGALCGGDDPRVEGRRRRGAAVASGV